MVLKCKVSSIENNSNLQICGFALQILNGHTLLNNGRILQVPQNHPFLLFLPPYLATHMHMHTYPIIFDSRMETTN